MGRFRKFTAPPPPIKIFRGHHRHQTLTLHVYGHSMVDLKNHQRKHSKFLGFYILRILPIRQDSLDVLETIFNPKKLPSSLFLWVTLVEEPLTATVMPGETVEMSVDEMRLFGIWGCPELGNLTSGTYILLAFIIPWNKSKPERFKLCTW